MMKNPNNKLRNNEMNINIKEMTNLIVDAAKKGAIVEPIAHITKEIAKKITKRATKQISEIQHNCPERKALIFSNYKKIIQGLAYEESSNRAVHELPRKDKLRIVAHEYIAAAVKVVDENDYKFKKVNGEKVLILKPNKEQYKGAINFNEFSQTEIREEIQKFTSPASNRVYWVVMSGLFGHQR